MESRVADASASSAEYARDQHRADPHHAFAFCGPFWVGLGGAELKDPGRVLPRSIIISVFGIMVAYLAMNIGVLGVVLRPFGRLHSRHHFPHVALLVQEFA